MFDMRYLFNFFFFFFFFSLLSAQEGMVTILEKGREEAVLFSLIQHRYNLDSQLPVEVWVEAGQYESDELSILETIQGVIVKTYPAEECLPLLFVCQYTSFSEFIYFDQDLVFTKDPAVLLKDPAYKLRGSLFFRSQLPNAKDIDEENYPEQTAHLKTLKKELRPFFGNMPYEFYKKLVKHLSLYAKTSSSLASSSLFVLNKDFFPALIDIARMLSCENHYKSVKGVDLIWMAIFMNHSNVSVNETSEINLVREKDPKNIPAQLHQGSLLCLSAGYFKQNGAKEVVDESGSVKRRVSKEELEALEALSNSYKSIIGD